MVAGDVVPLDSVIVEVVQDGDTSLISPGLAELTVVGLGPSRAARVGPVATPALGEVGGGDAAVGAGPEPAVDDGGLQVWPVAAVEVTLASGGPDVLDVALLKVLVHELGLVLGLDAHQVLAMLPACVGGEKGC